MTTREKDSSSSQNSNLGLPPSVEALHLADRIVREHDTFCVGHYEPDEPYCSCAPDDHPLCESCEKLKQAIAAALPAVGGPAVQDKDDDLSRVAPQVDCVAPVGSTAEKHIAEVIDAERTE